jgi:mannan endo-1,4-beta-mannosidase
MKETLESVVVQAEEGTLAGAFVSTEVKGYSGKGYVTGLRNDGDFVEVSVHIPCEGIYELNIRHASFGGEKRNILFVDDVCYGQFVTKQTSSFVELKICTTWLESGRHNLKVLKEWGGIDIDCFILKPTKKQFNESPSFTLVNPNASSECRALMSYFKDIYGKKIITGQHTAAANGPEIEHIKRLTGKKPALRGFDLLSYSLKTETEKPSDHKIIEINENRGSVEKAIEWNKKHKGIVTFCWHWYSPTGGKDKTFYTENTDFDLNKALIPGTEEHTSLLADMDEIAMHLKQLRDENVPCYGDLFMRQMEDGSGGELKVQKYIKNYTRGCLYDTQFIIN